MHFAGVIIDGPQGPHARISHIGTVLVRDVVVPAHHPSWIQADLPQRCIEPFSKYSLNVIVIAFNCSLAAAPPDQVDIWFSRPGLAKRNQPGGFLRLSFIGGRKTAPRPSLLGPGIPPPAE